MRSRLRIFALLLLALAVAVGILSSQASAWRAGMAGGLAVHDAMDMPQDCKDCEAAGGAMMAGCAAPCLAMVAILPISSALKAAMPGRPLALAAGFTHGNRGAPDPHPPKALTLS